jgi:hypothetical protein
MKTVLSLLNLNNILKKIKIFSLSAICPHSTISLPNGYYSDVFL